MYLLFNLLITIIAYLCIPFILKYLLKKNYTFIQARNISIINSIIICCCFIILRRILGYTEAIINLAPAFIWGYVSYLILKPNSKSKPKTDGTEVKNLIEVLEKNNKPERSDNSIDDVISKKSTDIHNNDEHNTNTETNDNKNKKVTNNKNYKVTLISLITVLIFITIAFVILIVYILNLKNTLSFKNTEINNLNARIKNLDEKISNYDDYYDDYEELKEESDFMEEFVVIVPENTSIYHKYGCKYLDLTSFLVFNIDNAKEQGYKPCSHCIK